MGRQVCLTMPLLECYDGDTCKIEVSVCHSAWLQSHPACLKKV